MPVTRYPLSQLGQDTTMMPTPECICQAQWVGQAVLSQVRSCQQPKFALLPFVNVLAAWLDWDRYYVMTDSASYLVKQNMGAGTYRI